SKLLSPALCDSQKMVVSSRRDRTTRDRAARLDGRTASARATCGCAARRQRANARRGRNGGRTMNQINTEREQRFIDLAATLADDFAERAARHDEEASFPHENYARMR